METRKDLDTSKIAFLEPSAGGFPLVYLTLENRYSAIVLQGAGLRRWDIHTHPDANPIHFAPLISAPKLMVQGKYDEAILLATEAQPLYNLLREPKDLVTYDGGHRPDPEVLLEKVNPWLDEILGPAK